MGFDWDVHVAVEFWICQPIPLDGLNLGQLLKKLVMYKKATIGPSELAARALGGRSSKRQKTAQAQADHADLDPKNFDGRHKKRFVKEVVQKRRTTGATSATLNY